ncbi:sulfatase-like hydrolase/transferase [Polynucleobacter sp. Fuers-14]|uniref:sulfatase-like hydrolase/transferase n=1 Tax=Polynucleobacter sp. Fuers-14 TaxID=1758364 RepID=UPI0021073FB0|nr:sulfatase-like hydrolase/transferase [Polynucleobacter sp. Fuers-14]
MLSCSGSGGGSSSSSSSGAPNILYVIMDDVGIDQMESFGYGGDTPPSMPNITAIARKGVRFRNTWSMPECSNGRASFFAGRYPFRTNIYQAIGGNDLANSQLTPYDVTVPKLLKNANYESAMFGKFHLAGPDNNQAGYNTPAQLGWDYFYGWIGGLPGSLDSTAGGIAASGTYKCGFVPSSVATSGACYYANSSCKAMSQTSLAQDAAGLQCLDSGGIFVPNQSCGTPPANLNFNEQNAYYVSPLLIIENGQEAVQVPLTDSRARGYRTRIEADAAIKWINGKKDSAKPWMATVSFSSAHTPWQQPPKKLIPVGNVAGADLLDCTNSNDGRVIQNQMTEGLDSEFGRIMIETGLATRGADGSLVYDPKASNTVIVIVGDNGTLGNAVKLPFNAQEAKGTAYQTGVWDPLIVAGPMVAAPDREVDHMVNMVDLFQFFGELAGLDAHALVPRTIDSVGLLPYLTKPDQSSLRTINFTQGGYNIQANGGRNAPCVFSASSCSQVPISKSVCQDNGGVWWGSGYTDPTVIPNSGVGYTSCYAVNQAKYIAGGNSMTAPAPNAQVKINPEKSTAIRNTKYKLIQNYTQTFAPGTTAPNSLVSYELYEINQAAPVPKLDDPSLAISIPYAGEALAAYNDLYAKLQSLLISEPYCPGDGNNDGVVNAEDLSNWQKIYSIATSSNIWSSVYNFMVSGVWNGITSTTDEQTIKQNLGNTCPKTYSIY